MSLLAVIESGAGMAIVAGLGALAFLLIVLMLCVMHDIVLIYRDRDYD